MRTEFEKEIQSDLSGQKENQNVIVYEFADGTTSEVAVSGEIYSVYEQLQTQEKSNNRKETRRHISLDYLKEKGVSFADNESDPYYAVERKELQTRMRKALSKLEPEHRLLLQKVFYESISISELAKEKGVSYQGLSQKLERIYNKLKKFL
ncbi:MAG: sigma-70 family RNA polymerase sigma factor [Firmicutes bacterium]|nr:sigma-70 family RNA polymerase sigma factor [Bacillota bacterium]